MQVTKGCYNAQENELHLLILIKCLLSQGRLLKIWEGSIHSCSFLVNTLLLADVSQKNPPLGNTWKDTCALLPRPRSLNFKKYTHVQLFTGCSLKISSFLSIIPGSAVLPGIFLEMQMPRFLSPPKLSSETLQDRFKNWCFTKVARLFWCMLKFENQGSESLEMGVSTEWAEWVIFWGRCLQKRRGE